VEEQEIHLHVISNEAYICMPSDPRAVPGLKMPCFNTLDAVKDTDDKLSPLATR